MNELKKIQDAHKRFVQERNWDRFQTSKNLSMAIAVEAGELVEIFMWLTEKQAKALNEERLNAVSDEMADIFIYLLRLADVLNIDLIRASEQKMIKNEIKYPIEKGKALAEALEESP